MLELLAVVPFLCAVPALFHELASSTLLHARAPGAVNVSLGASELLPMMAILPFMLYQLAGFGTLHFVVSRPVNWAINIAILGLIIASYVANREGAYGTERVLTGLLVLGLGATVFFGILQTQADADGLHDAFPAQESSKNAATCATAQTFRKRRDIGGQYIVWWISYRGEGKAGVDNIGVFEDDGTPRKKHPLLLDPSPEAHPLHIARGFALVGDDLYIANAWRRDSHVARYRRRGDTFHFAEVVVTTKQISAMVHPFDVEFGDDGRLYVSCQDTNTVLAILPKTRKPAPVASHLRKNFPNGNFLPGTLVASSQGRLPEVRRPRAAGRSVAAGPRGGARRARQAPALRARHRRASQASLCGGRSGNVVKVYELKTGRLVARIRGRSSRNPCTSSCTATRSTSAPPAPAASSPTTSPK